MSSRQLVIGFIFCISLASLIVACLAYTETPKREHFNLKKTSESFPVGARYHHHLAKTKSPSSPTQIPPPKRFWTRGVNRKGKLTHFEPQGTENGNISSFLDGKWTVYYSYDSCRYVSSKILVKNGKWKSVAANPIVQPGNADDIKPHQLQFEWAAVPSKYANSWEDKGCKPKDVVYNWPSAIDADFIENTGRLRVTYTKTISKEHMEQMCPGNPGVANLTEPIKFVYSAVVCAPMGNNGGNNIPDNTLTNSFAINRPIIWDVTGFPANYGTADPNGPKIGNKCFPFAGLTIPQYKLIWTPGWVGEKTDMTKKSCESCGIRSPPGGDLGQPCVVSQVDEDPYSVAKMTTGGYGGACVWNNASYNIYGLKCIPERAGSNQGTCKFGVYTPTPSSQ